MSFTSFFDHLGMSAFFVLVLVLAALGAFKLVREFFPW